MGEGEKERRIEEFSSSFMGPLTCREKVSSRSVSMRPLGGSKYSLDLRTRLEPYSRGTGAQYNYSLCFTSNNPILYGLTIITPTLYTDQKKNQIVKLDTIVTQKYEILCININLTTSQNTFSQSFVVMNQGLHSKVY